MSQYAVTENVDKLQRFFKTKPGEYAEGDIFIGVRVPDQRTVARKYQQQVSLGEVEQLLHSPIHEHRLTALFICVGKYMKAKQFAERKSIFDMYDRNTDWCNNWDLVDSSAHHIAGAFAYETSPDCLYQMADDPCLWRNRIAMVATLYYIRKRDIDIVFDIAKLLLGHKHDLIHKAVGWMLREAGKVSRNTLYDFLQNYYDHIPRTALRYSIEKFPQEERLRILRGEF